MSDETVRILVFSDDKDKRAAVINGIGLRASKDTPRIEWVEAATGFGVRDAFDQQDFALLVLDAESKKEGGMSVAQDLQETRDGVPPIIFLTARPRTSGWPPGPVPPPRFPTRLTRSSFRKLSPRSCAGQPDESARMGSDHRFSHRR